MACFSGKSRYIATVKTVKKGKTMASTPEFSRPIAVEGITPDTVRKESIEATTDECHALAARFGQRDISNLKASLRIRRVSGGAVVHVAGNFDADITQTCVVSLQDVHVHLQGDFETFFTEDPDKAANEDEFSVDEIAEDAPEMIANGVIDLGEVVAQYLALEIDPYPRAPGVTLAAQMVGSGTEGKNKPFRVLEGLQDSKTEKNK